MKKITLIILGLALIISLNSKAQGVAINEDSQVANASAILDISSTSKGILIPRMTKANRDAFQNLEEGLMIYQTDNTPGYYFYNGTSWGLIGTGTLGINDLVDGKTNSTSVFIGENAGLNNTGAKNTSIGIGTLQANTNGIENTATGYQALSSNTTGQWNTANGFNALQKNNSHRNTAIGSYALSENINGLDNTAVGFNAMLNNTAYNNTAIGSESMHTNTSGNQNTACGYYTLYSNISGVKNIAIGNEALYRNTIGFENIAIGNLALYYNQIGGNNVAVGNGALHMSTGSSNTAIGHNALYNNTSNENTAIGSKALYSNTTGIWNCAFGRRAMENNTEGHGNISIGNSSLDENISGDDNVAIGRTALDINETGSYNIAIGYSAGPNSGYTALDNSIAIGKYVGVSESNRVEIGNSSITWIGGEKTWSTYSDKRIKEDIKSDVPGLDFILKLQPVSYKLNIHKQNEMLYGAKAAEMDDWKGKYDIEEKRITGFLAQDVEQAAKELNYEFSGVTAPKNKNDLFSISYAEFVMPLVKAVQELEQENEILRNQLDELSKRLDNLENNSSSKNTNQR